MLRFPPHPQPPRARMLAGDVGGGGQEVTPSVGDWHAVLELRAKEGWPGCLAGARTSRVSGPGSVLGGRREQN